MIDAETLRSLLDYSPVTGVFTWRVTRGGKAHKGDVAGAVNNLGYILITVDGATYRAHRLAWLYVYGEWPEQYLDHINCVRSDNRIVNLRLATLGQNQANRRKTKGVLPKGVKKHRKKFAAQICVDGKRMYIGVYATAELAHAAYCEAAQKAFGAYHRAE